MISKKTSTSRPPFLDILRDRNGNFAIMTALLMVPLIGVAGVAIDFANTLSAKTELSAAADAAAVGAVAAASPAFKAAMRMTGDGDIPVGAVDARTLFSGQTLSADAKHDLKTTIVLQRRGKAILSQVTYSATIPTTLSRILGFNIIPVSGTATARYETPAFVNFHILVDNSPSMGVGATPADVAKLERSTGGCAFACHIKNGNTEDPNDNYHIAKAIKALMRIDLVRMAVISLVDTAKSERKSDDQFKMAVYTFGARLESASHTVVSNLTSDLDQVKGLSNKIDLMTIPFQNFKDDTATDMDGIFKSTADLIGASGTGTSLADAQQVLLLISDGVTNTYKSNCSRDFAYPGAPRCIEPIDSRICKKLKDRGVKIAVLYTTYHSIKGDWFYDAYVKPFLPAIPTSMRSCASPELYFEVTPTEGISDAMNALFTKIVRRPRITG